MFTKHFKEISIDDLYCLKYHNKEESREIDYKLQLPDFNDPKSRENFLIDICAFANTIGGYLLYGVAEKKGVVDDFSGLEIENQDQETRRMSHIIRSNINLPIIGFDIRFMPIPTKNRYICLIKIPMSMNKPHAVKGTGKFYSRFPGCNMIMDVHEVRTSVLASETLENKIKDFRQKRISSLLTDEIPVKVLDHPKVLLQLIPVSSVLQPCKIDVNNYGCPPDGNLIPLLGMERYGDSSRFTLEGIYRERSPGEHNGYTLLYRSGIVESVKTIDKTEGNEFILYGKFETEISSFIKQSFRIFKKHVIQPPIIMMLTLLGVKGTFLAQTERDYRVNRNVLKFDRDILSIDMTIDDYDSYNLKQIFDPVWQCAGFPCSLTDL